MFSPIIHGVASKHDIMEVKGVKRPVFFVRVLNLSTSILKVMASTTKNFSGISVFEYGIFLGDILNFVSKLTLHCEDVLNKHAH